MMTEKIDTLENPRVGRTIVVGTFRREVTPENEDIDDARRYRWMADQFVNSPETYIGAAIMGKSDLDEYIDRQMEERLNDGKATA